MYNLSCLTFNHPNSICKQQTREVRYSELRVILEDNVKLRDKAEDRFQSYFEREVHKIHNDIRNESEVQIYTICFKIICFIIVNESSYSLSFIGQVNFVII